VRLTFLNTSSIDLIENLSFCVIDLETTGGNHQTDRIIEIGLVKIKKLKIVEKKSILINPQIAISDFIQKLTGIRQRDVEKAPIIEDVLQEVVAFIDTDVLVAHNISFDIPFLNAVLAKHQYPQLTNKVLCTNVMTKHLIPEIMNSNLNYMSKLFSIEHNKAHRAQDDALATAELLIRYLEIFIIKNIRKINQIYYPRNKFELDRVNFTNSEENQKAILELCHKKDSPLYLILKGHKGIILGTLPIESPPNELMAIKEFLSLVDWEVCTIKLTGQIVDGLLYFNNHLTKYNIELKDFTIAHLKKRYLSENQLESESKSELELNTNPIVSYEEIDFIVTPHLIEEQLAIYPLFSMSQGTRFIFKYPGHKRKMLQYLHSKMNYIVQHNINLNKKKNPVDQSLDEIFKSILSNVDPAHQRQFMMINQKDLLGNEEKLFQRLDIFTSSIRRKFKFPSNYL